MCPSPPQCNSHLLLSWSYFELPISGFGKCPVGWLLQPRSAQVKNKPWVKPIHIGIRQFFIFYFFFERELESFTWNNPQTCSKILNSHKLCGEVLMGAKWQISDGKCGPLESAPYHQGRPKFQLVNSSEQSSDQRPCRKQGWESTWYRQQLPSGWLRSWHGTNPLVLLFSK